MLGHDLKNPLAAIDSGTRLLANTALDDRAKTIVSLIRESVGRMLGLIDNVLDLARGRLGGGLTLTRSADQPLAPPLEHVIAELRTTWPDRQIDVDLDLPRPVDCDRARIAQLLSNLVANALTHGADAPVKVRASLDGAALELSVENQGDAIPPDVLACLFEPFYRGPTDSRNQGLGLGLYIASEIARAHGGTLTATSTSEATRFVLRIPA